VRQRTWIIIGLLADLTVVAFLVRLRRRGNDQAAALGPMSERWLAEYGASRPP
jgi:hypothetical protein